MRGATGQGSGRPAPVGGWWLGSVPMDTVDPALALIDRERYPVDAPDSPVRAEVVASARAQIAEAGYAELPGFVTPEAIAALVADAEAHTHRAHRSTGPGTAYLELPDEEAEETEGDSKYENDDDELETEEQTPETDVAKDAPEKRPVNAGDSHTT